MTICKRRNGESGNGVRKMGGMRVGMQRTRLKKWGIGYGNAANCCENVGNAGNQGQDLGNRIGNAGNQIRNAGELG